MKVYFGEDPYFRVVKLIDSISLNTKRHVEKQLKLLNMTYSQLAVLMLLHNHDRVSQRELADLGDTDTTNMAVILDSLEKRGWIKRVLHETDRRINRICLTDNGRNAYAEAQDILVKGIEFVRRQTSTEDLLRVQPFLEELNVTTKKLCEGKFEKTADLSVSGKKGPADGPEF